MPGVEDTSVGLLAAVADGSLHVTNGGVNPVLTILALAWRTSRHLAAELTP